MALSAGEVFVNLVVRGEGVKPALQAASSHVRDFGKSLSVAAVATGSLIAEGVKFALSKMKDVAVFAFEAAKLDPETAAEARRFEGALSSLSAAAQKLGVNVLSIVLPALRLMVDGLTGLIDMVNQGIDWLDQFGVVAALQTGDVSSAFEIMWAEVQIVFLQGSQAILGLWDTMINGILGAWDSMSTSLVTALAEPLRQIGSMITSVADQIARFVPSVAAQLKTIGQMVEGAGVVAQAGTGLAQSADASRAAERAAQAEEAQRLLQQQIDQLRKQSNDQARSAVTKRDLQRVEDAASLALDTGKAAAQSTGVSGTFAIQAAGGNVQFQTQKDMLKEIREQKALQKQQLEAQREANKRPGARFA